MFDLLEETLVANNLISPQNQPQQQATNINSNLQTANQQQQQQQTNQLHLSQPKHQSKGTQQTTQQTELTNLSHCTEENDYICMTSLPALNIYRTIENQQLLIEKEKFEQTKFQTDKKLDKQLCRHILNELDFEPKLVSSSIESIILQLLQQIENRLNEGENEEEIFEFNENIKLGIDPNQFKTIFDVVEQMVQDKLKQEQTNKIDQDQNLFKDQENKYEMGNKQNNDQVIDQIGQDKQNLIQDQVEKREAAVHSKEQTIRLTEQQAPSLDQNAANLNQNQPPPSIQVDFISSDRSSPRRSSSQRSSLNAEEACEAAKLAKEKIEAVNSKLDLRELRLQYQRQLELNNRQQFFLKTLSICLNPVIILRLLQHRLFGCFNQLWYWQQNTGGSHHPSICLSNSNQTALYHLLNTRANNSGRSSFASTIGMESFQGMSLSGALGSRSRASSATANSIILPNELFEPNLRNRRNVSLTINCPLGLSLSNLNSYTGAGGGGGGSSSQRTSISVDRSSKQDSYRKASVRSGSGDDQSSLFQQQGILLSGLNLHPNLTAQNATSQDEIAEFQKQLQNIPRNECSPIAARNFLVSTAVSSAGSNQLLISSSDSTQQRRNTATLLPQSVNTSMDSMVVPNRPRSCSMPQQQQQQLNSGSSLQQHQQTANQIINQITNQITNQTPSNQASSNQNLSSQLQTHSNQLPNVQLVHNLTNQQLQTLINQQLQSQNLINQHLQNQFKSQNYSSQQQLNQQQKNKQQNYYQQADQSTSQNNSLEEKSHVLNAQGSLDSLSLTPLLVYHPQQRNFFDRSLSIAVPEPMIFQQTQFKQLMPNQRPLTSSNQSVTLDASSQNLNVNCSHSSVSTNPVAGHFTNAGRYSFSLRSTSGDAYSLLATNTLSMLIFDANDNLKNKF